MAKRATVKQKNIEHAKDGNTIRNYGLKLRMVPTAEQMDYFNKCIGCARFTYNFYLTEKQEVYKTTGETLSYGVFKKAFIQLKDHAAFSWLSVPDKFVLEKAMEDLDEAYNNFFEGRAGFPTKKKKHASKQSYTTCMTNDNIKFDYEHKTVQLPKAGRVKVRVPKKYRKSLKGRITAATISRHSSGEWYVAFKIEEVVPLRAQIELKEIADDDIIAVDLGLTHFLIDSNGNKVENPHFYKQAMKKLAHLQRQLENKEKGSSNYKKQQVKIAKWHRHIANMRKDFLHQQSRKMVNENQVVILEDLNVKGMIRNRKLSRSIQDIGWGAFKQYVTYKAVWDNKHVVFVDTFFPSSKKCHGCKEKHTLLSLSDRVWICPNCGCEHDRDVNAAKNIKEEGLRLLKERLAV